MNRSIIQLSANDFVLSNNNVYVNHRAATKVPGILLIWADWCPHCHEFIPKLNQLCQRLGDEFKCAAVEHSQLQKSRRLAEGLEFKYFPTIKFFDQSGRIIGTYPENKPREIVEVMEYICKMYHHCIMHH